MSANSRYVPALRFHALTPAYDLVVRATTRERRFKSALVEQAGVRPGQRVLDLACGTGTLAISIKQRQPQAEVHGIDGDPNILGMAAHKAQQSAAVIAFERGLSFALPYPDRRFDRVVASLFFHHLSWGDKERTALEILRVLRPGGELHVADWGRATGPLMRAAFVGIQLLDGFENTRDHVAGRLPELFERAGFVGVRQTQSFSTLFGTLALYRAVKPDATELYLEAT